MGVRERILQRLDSELELPSLPAVVTRLMHLVEDPDADADSVAELIGYDPALTGQVIRVANTVEFGVGLEVESLVDAVTRVGMRRTRDLVLTLAVANTIPDPPGVDLQAYWRHCASVALAAQVIERLSPHIRLGSAWTYPAGLLHNIGVLVLAKYFPLEYGDVLARARKQEKELVQIEYELLGMSHRHISAITLKKWGFPPVVVDGARYYNNPDAAPEESLAVVRVIHIANVVCLNQGISSGIEAFPSGFSDTAWEAVGLTLEQSEDILERVNEEARKAKALFSV